MKLWKVLGVAGVAGVAATGVAVARSERRRKAYEPDEVRARLHQRHVEAMGADTAPPVDPRPAGEAALGCLGRPGAAIRRRFGRRRSS